MQTPLFWDALSCMWCLHYGGTHGHSLQDPVWKVGDAFVVGHPNHSYLFISLHS